MRNYTFRLHDRDEAVLDEAEEVLRARAPFMGNLSRADVVRWLLREGLRAAKAADTEQVAP